MNHAPLSKNRAVILEVLKASAQPLSAYDILGRVKQAGINSPPIVYRALKFLEEEGLIHRIESKNAYIACHGEHPRQTTSILMVCETCGKVEEAADASLATSLDQTAREHQFHLHGAAIELHGDCKHCHA